jgi:hypothetical protein
MSKFFPWQQTREARDKVVEYLRQRKLQNRDLGTVIHVTHTDVNAEMASLTIEDLEAVLSRLERVEASLAACQEELMKYEG